MILASQLKKLMAKNGQTVAQLSRATGVSSKMLYSWLESSHPSDLNAVKTVADYYEVSLDFLLFNVSKSEKRISLEDIRDEISLGVLELVVRKPRK